MTARAIVLRISPMRAVAVALALSLVACDSQRLKKLEQENHDLRNRVAVSDLNLQEQCSRDAKNYFKERWSGNESYSIHYSRKLGKCFIEVNYSEGLADNGDDGISAVAEVSDIYGGTNAVALFEYESRISHDGKTLRPLAKGNGIITCFISGRPACNSRDQFDSEVAKYLGND